VVLQGRPSGISHQNNDLTIDISKTHSFSTCMPSIIKEHEVDDVLANHNDNKEDLWENIPM